MPSIVRPSRAAVIAAFACGCATALPGGWRAATTDGVQVYRHQRGGLQAEFRLHPAEASTQSLADWFEARRLGPQAGYRGSFKATKQSTPTLLFANGDGRDAQGRAVYVIRMGCQRPQGGLVFAEAVVSADLDHFQQLVPEVGRLFEPACFSDTPAVTAPASPSNAAAKPRQAKDAPYAHAAAPGQGLKAGDIETMLWEWRNEQSGMTMQVNTYYYLLLKDGSYRDDMPPVALEDFDAAGERRAEPRKWGRWTRVGSHYLLVRTGSQHANKIGANMARHPAQRDEKLDGAWEIRTAYSTAWSVARSSRAIRFSRDGRFSRNSGGSVVGGAGSADAGNAVSGSVAYDDDGSSATIGTAVAGGGSSRQRPSTLSDRSGSYRLEGYTLELRYDSGRVERLPFVAEADRDTLYFKGEELSRVKPGKR